MTNPSLTSRRQFIQTFAFSAAALLAGRGGLRAASQADPKARHMFVFGDWGALNISPPALFMLGNNFYGQFDGGTACPA